MDAKHYNELIELSQEITSIEKLAKFIEEQ